MQKLDIAYFLPPKFYPCFYFLQPINQNGMNRNLQETREIFSAQISAFRFVKSGYNKVMNQPRTARRTKKHDRLFKTLLTSNFIEFIAAMLPNLLLFLEPDSIEFLDKEIFTDITAGERHEADLIVKVRFRGQDAFFIIHVENQATSQTDFPRRMFVYFARLHEKFGLPIYPVVIFSYDTPTEKAVSRYVVKCANKTILTFDYTVLQLKRMNWRKFLKTPNPVAAALMTKMNIAEGDKAKVRAAIFRMMTTLKLDPARAQLISLFMENYLKLTTAQMAEFLRQVDALPPKEKEETMEMMNYWEKRGVKIGRAEGRAEGLTQGKETLVVRQIRKRFGFTSPETLEWLDRLSAEQLDELGESLFDFNELADLENWLKQRAAP